MCVCVCVRACVRVCVCVHACVRVFVYACVTERQIGCENKAYGVNSVIH